MKLGKAGEAYFLERKKQVFLDSHMSRRQSSGSYETSPTVTMDDEISYKSLTSTQYVSNEKNVDMKSSGNTVANMLCSEAAVEHNTNSPRYVYE